MNADITTRIADREEVLLQIRRILIDGLDVKRDPDEIDPDAPLFGSGLGLDSIDVVELVLLIEARFGVRLENDVMARASMRTVNSLVDRVVAHRSAQQ
ncbi:MAG: phosphopantetheine-binding protein [Gemmatimonadaceae bacterium]